MFAHFNVTMRKGEIDVAIYGNVGYSKSVRDTHRLSKSMNIVMNSNNDLDQTCWDEEEENTRKNNDVY